MSKQKLLSVSALTLDRENPRIGNHDSQNAIVNSLIEAHPEEFWSLMGSLLEEDGYEPTENILVLETDDALVVKEGNRRIAALKLIAGEVSADHELPTHVKNAISSLTEKWRKSNQAVPCLVYSMSEKAKLEKIVSRIHGKRAQAGRLMWESLAKARDHRRQGGSEPALDILDRYLARGPKLKKYAPRERWDGMFPYSVLEEAVKKLAPLMGKKNSKELAAAYPDGMTKKLAATVERVVFDIGMEQVQTRDFRNDEWAEKYGLTSKTGSSTAANKKKSKGSTTSSADSKGKGSASAKAPALAVTDPRLVSQKMGALVLC